MTSDELVRELSAIIFQPERLAARLPAWQDQCATHLQSLPEDDARSLIEQLQALIHENRSLFEQESEEILEVLADQRQVSRHSAKTRKYRDVGGL